MKDKIRRTKVVDVLRRTDYGSIVSVKGWVRTHRSSKSVDFIALNDGSTINNVQVVVDPSKFDESLLKQITTGACVHATGELVASQGAGQAVRYNVKSWNSMVCVAMTIRCRRKARVLRRCARMLICVCAPTHLGR